MRLLFMVSLPTVESKEERDKGVLAIPAFGGGSAEPYDRLKCYYKNSMKD